MTPLGKFVTFVVIVLVLVGGGYLFTKKSLPGVPTKDAQEQKEVDKEPIKIGFIAPLTGDASNLGTNERAAVELAADEINASGGAGGRQIEIVYEDGKCNGKDAANAANKLLNVDHVAAILGGTCSSETMAFSGAADAAKVPVLSPCSSAPAVTDAGDYIFRNYPSDTFQGAYAAKYIYETLGKKNTAVLYVKTDYGSGISAVFKEKFVEMGGKIVFDEGYEQTQKDFRPQLAKVKSVKPDVLYFIGYTEASISSLKQAKELKLGVPLFGVDAWDDSKIFTEAGAAADGIMYTVAASLNPDDFKAKMKTKTGSDEVLVCSPYAYDGLGLLSGVISKVGLDGAAIKNELYQTSYTGGVSLTKIEFDKNGDVKEANYIVKVVKDGKAEELKPIADQP